jgi:hypothetical protein
MDRRYLSGVGIMICNICQCNIFEDEQMFRLWHDPTESVYDLCILCAAGAEKLGWKLEVVQ